MMTNFPEAGETCPCCQDFWEEQGAKPKTLINLVTNTLRYHSDIAVCSYCDGEPIFKLSIKAYQEQQDEEAV